MATAKPVSAGSSAGRLYLVLEKALAQNADQPCRVVFAKALGIESMDAIEVLYGVSELIELVRQTDRDLKDLIEVDPELFLEPLQSIGRALGNFSLGGNFRSVREGIGPETMTALRFCADMLYRYRKEEIIEKADLDAIVSEIEDLRDQVGESDIDAGLREVIIARLEDVRRAIKAYELLGAEGIRDAVDTAVGATVRARTQISVHQGVKVVNDYLTFLEKVDSIVRRAQPYIQLAVVAARGFLGDGSTPALPSGTE